MHAQQRGPYHALEEVQLLLRLSPAQLTAGLQAVAPSVPAQGLFQRGGYDQIGLGNISPPRARYPVDVPEFTANSSTI